MLIEALIAALITATCIAGIVSGWYFSFHMTGLATDQEIACNIGRQVLENVKETGFSYTPEAPASAPVVTYYDGLQNVQGSGSPSKKFKVTLTVVSDQTVNGSNPVQPAPTALRTVTVTVTLVQTGVVLCQMSTYLVRAGI